MADSTTSSDLLRNSTLYREFLAEREEIMRHKWLESEKAGSDIGFEEALTNWMVNHRSSGANAATPNGRLRNNLNAFNAVLRGRQGR